MSNVQHKPHIWIISGACDFWNGRRRGVMLRWRRAARLCAVGNFPYDLNYSCRRRSAGAFHADKVSLSVLTRRSTWESIPLTLLGAGGGVAQTALSTSGWMRSEAECPTVLLGSSHEGRKHSVKEDRGFFFYLLISVSG